MIARGQNLAAIRANEIVMKAPNCNIVARVDATDEPATLGPQDAVVVAVKAPALPSIAERACSARWAGRQRRIRNERHSMVVFTRPWRSAGRPVVLAHRSG